MLGNEALATRTYCWNMLFFVLVFSISIAQAGSILIGHLVGQRRVQAAYLMGRFTHNISISISFVLALFMALIGGEVLNMLTDNPDIIALGKGVFWINVFLEVGRATNIWATQSLRATGDVNFPFYVGIVVQWIVSVGGSYLLGVHWGFGLLGMWASFALDEDIRGAIFVFRWKSKKWATKGFVK
jgi:Na+-driven multidrug efflux pump